MKLLPLCVFWSLWLLNFFTRTSFSPILHFLKDTRFNFQSGILWIGILTPFSFFMVKYLQNH